MACPQFRTGQPTSLRSTVRNLLYRLQKNRIVGAIHRECILRDTVDQIVVSLSLMPRWHHGSVRLLFFDSFIPVFTSFLVASARQEVQTRRRTSPQAKLSSLSPSNDFVAFECCCFRWVFSGKEARGIHDTSCQIAKETPGSRSHREISQVEQVAAKSSSTCRGVCELQDGTVSRKSVCAQTGGS